MTAPELTRDGRLPAARPNVCQSIDCHAATRTLLRNTIRGRDWWVCRRCAEELCARPNWRQVEQ